jgi:hypothetical protein
MIAKKVMIDNCGCGVFNQHGEGVATLILRLNQEVPERI